MIYLYIIITLMINCLFNILVSLNYEAFYLLLPLLPLTIIPALKENLDEKNYLIISILLALIMYLFSEEVLLLNVFTFLLIAYIDKKIIKDKINLFKYLLVTLLNIIIYYMIIITIKDIINSNFNIMNQINLILNSIILNLVYSSITYILLCRNKTIKKIYHK